MPPVAPPLLRSATPPRRRRAASGRPDRLTSGTCSSGPSDLTYKTCPFGPALRRCGAACLLALALVPGCADPAHAGTSAAPDTSSSTTIPTTPEPTTAVPGASTGAGTSDASSAGTSTGDDPATSFILAPDGMPGLDACDPWIQDCPIGHKCAPVSSDENTTWELLRCVPVVREPADLGEPCARLGDGGDGLDTCAVGLVCLDVDPATELGVCRGLCTGSPDDPMCLDPAAVCQLVAGGQVALCAPTCDPLAQDCPLAGLCLYNPQDGGQTFVCFPDAGGDAGQAFDPCVYINVCDPGLLCLGPTGAAECDPAAQGCCLPFCDLGAMPGLCPGVGQECLPWYGPGAAPPGLEDVGFCSVPS